MKTQEQFEGKVKISMFLSKVLIAVLLMAVGYGMGRINGEFFPANMASEDRDSFCQLDWIIADFQAGFLKAYCDLMVQSVSEKPAWNRYREQYRAWLETDDLSDTPGAWERFQEEHQPAPNYDPFALANLLNQKLEKLESGSPAPVIIRHLLHLHKELGQTEEYEKLISFLQRRYPEHPLAVEYATAGSDQ